MDEYPVAIYAVSKQEDQMLLMPDTHRRRRRDSTRQLRCVGVCGVHWALETARCESLSNIAEIRAGGRTPRTPQPGGGPHVAQGPHVTYGI